MTLHSMFLSPYTSACILPSVPLPPFSPLPLFSFALFTFPSFLFFLSLSSPPSLTPSSPVLPPSLSPSLADDLPTEPRSLE